MHKTTAYHEAGHAVAAYLSGFNIIHVTIESTYPGAAGECLLHAEIPCIPKYRVLSITPNDWHEYQLWKRENGLTIRYATQWNKKFLIYVMAGVASVTHLEGDELRFICWDEDYQIESDLEQAIETAKKIVYNVHDTDEDSRYKAEALAYKSAYQAEKFVVANWTAIEAVASALLNLGTLTGHQVGRIIQEQETAELPEQLP